jgi:hypothetical protein
LSKEGVETETNDIEIELYDAQSALVSIGKHHAIFTDKTDITSGGKPLDFSKLSDDKLLMIAQGNDPDDIIPG